MDLTKLPKEAEVFSEKTSLVFKETRVVRLIDLAHRTLVYLAYSTRVVEGSPSIAFRPSLSVGAMTRESEMKKYGRERG